MSALYLLRVEGLNFSWVIDDTHDLSTIAGGSRLLEEPPKLAQKCLADHGDVRRLAVVQCAAAVGVFAFCAEPGAAGRVLTDVRRAVSAGDLVHLTVAVEAVEIDGEYPSNAGAHDAGVILARVTPVHFDQLRAAVRRSQLNAPTVAAPPRATNATEPCKEDNVRPATHGPWSEFTHARRQVGKSFIRSAGSRVEAARTFDGLTSCKDPNDPRHGRLAVITVDGLAFGATIQELCKTGVEFREFSDQLQSAQKAFITTLVDAWAANPDCDLHFNSERAREDDPASERRVLRFQQLVSAGDDATYLMPAWLAWDFLDRFFKHSWVVDPTKTGAERRLKFRAGVVLCHHNAPIHRIRGLADDLAALAKKQATPAITHPIAYEVLKSFDLVGSDLDVYRARRSGGLSPVDLLLDGATLKTTSDEMIALDRDPAVPIGDVKNPARRPKGREPTAYHLSQWRDFLPGLDA